MIIMDRKSNLTEVLLEEEATSYMVDDFNLANYDIEDLDLDNLKLMDKNITSVIASLEDLKRTVAEKIDEICENNNIEKKIEKILKGYTNKAKENIDNQHADNSIKHVKKSKDILPQNNERNLIEDLLEIEERKVEDNGCVSEALNSIAKNKPEKKSLEKKIPDEITKAIEIVRKYNLNIPYYSTGKVIECINNGITNMEEEKWNIVGIYSKLLETNMLDKSDRQYIADVLGEYLGFNDEIKSLLGLNPNARIMI